MQVLDRAMKQHGRPRHFVSDQESQFTAAVFRETLDPERQLPVLVPTRKVA